ncbi:MAG TPA: hypothetical protein VEL74_24685 [Thermoanaerobaculia bacterium]|nr:hypothetical protein [Thermoanaerobaculia bacterium]
MSEPGSIPPPPPPVSPFQPRPVEPVPSRGGCGKPVVIGCVAALLLGAIVLLGGIWYVANNPDVLNKMMNLSLSQLETGLMQQLPPGVTAEEKARLQAAFAGAKEAIQSGRPSPEELQEFNMQLFPYSRKAGNMTRQDVQDLTELLERLARGEPTGSGGRATS